MRRKRVWASALVYGVLYGANPNSAISSISSNRGINDLTDPKGVMAVRPPLASAIVSNNLHPRANRLPTSHDRENDHANTCLTSSRLMPDPDGRTPRQLSIRLLHAYVVITLAGFNALVQVLELHITSFGR
jgi:hypothetical protein